MAKKATAPAATATINTDAIDEKLLAAGGKVINLIPHKISSFNVVIRGVSPLIVHRFSEKTIRQIEEKQQKKAKGPKEARDPHAEYLASMYPMQGSVAGAPNAEYGVPAVWFKRAAVDACRFSDGLKMTILRGAFHVMADKGDLVKLNYDALQMRMDAVTIAMGTRDLRYRAEFSDWWVRLKIRYNAAVVTPEQLVNLLHVAGFGCGVGERRPSQQCSDQFGMFEVDQQQTAGVGDSSDRQTTEARGKTAA